MHPRSHLNKVLLQDEARGHPWERFIKNAYADKIKTAHNSINNLHYPKKGTSAEKLMKRVKFTVIGNRVTEEFIYCINLVKGLHKYKKKRFESPVIRGVTSVDWPAVWNDLKIKYGGIAYCLTSQVVVFVNDKIIGGEKELKELIEQDYTYHLSLNYYKESIAQFSNFIRGSGLYADVVPYTCENFLRLCQAKKGGYSGTPVHRIVKDGWIQCGGFGLKSTKLDCENFIVPPDKRGVLCMANAGRHVDCSTQFFVLLQPSPWMLHKYVAFGQLIDGDSTLRKIENVESWYESPTKNIIIYKAGVLNIDCQDIMINRGAQEYIYGHIEDLFALEETLWEELMERVFSKIHALENPVVGEGEEECTPDLDLHATKRFMKKGIAPQNRPSVQSKTHKSKSQDESKLPQRQDPKEDESERENNDFDVSVYDYEYEGEGDGYSYKVSVKVPESGSLVVKPEKPYYIPLTDVPYPGEVTSEYDLKKLLRGDYCLETDLETDKPEKAACIHKTETYPAELFAMSSGESSRESQESLDSDQEAEINKYLKERAALKTNIKLLSKRFVSGKSINLFWANAYMRSSRTNPTWYHIDNTSFAGDIVRGISKGRHNHLLKHAKAEQAALTDDELRYIRLLKWEEEEKELYSHKKVSLQIPGGQKSHTIHRRQTGFILPSNWERRTMLSFDSDSVFGDRKVHIDPSMMGSTPTPTIERRPTAFVRPGALGSDSDIDIVKGHDRQSVMKRLFDEQGQNLSPTLRDYRPSTAAPEQNLLLTLTPTNIQINSNTDYEHYRGYLARDSLGILHRKPNSESLIRFPLRRATKTRPAVTVGEYQAKNNKKIYQEDE